MLQCDEFRGISLQTETKERLLKNYIGLNLNQLAHSKVDTFVMN